MKAVSLHDVPYVDTEQMIEVDRAMIEDFRIELIQMMENAGRNLAHLARVRFLDGDPRGKQVLALAGGGGNGGGVLVAARRLHNWGADVQIGLGQDPDAMSRVARHQLDILQRMGVAGTGRAAETSELTRVRQVAGCDLILDGLIGYSLKGAPRGLIGELIRFANGADVAILSLDAPSGFDTTSGIAFDPAIKATATMTLALPKAGLRRQGSAELAGQLYLADISVPPHLYIQPAFRIDVGPLFAEDDVIRLF